MRPGRAACRRDRCRRSACARPGSRARDARERRAFDGSAPARERAVGRQTSLPLHAPGDRGEDRRGHRRERRQRLVAVAVLLEVHLRHPLQPHRPPHVDQHRRLDAVAGRERERFQELAPRGHLAGERLAHTRELGVEERERGARHQMVDAATAVRVLDRPLRERPAVEALDEGHTRLAHERADQAGGEVRRETLRVGVEEADELAFEHRQRTPHRIALTEHGAVLGHQLLLLPHDRTGALGAHRRAVGGGRVDDDDLVDGAGLAQRHERLDHRRDRSGALARGQADRHAATALGCDPRGRIQRMVERAGSRPALGGRLRHRLSNLKSLALDRRTEPWSALLDAGREDGRLVREAREGPGEARLVAVPAELHPDVAAALASAGIERLYAHQAQALYAASEGPVIVTTGTASGKSLCFNLPTLHLLCEQAGARALSLYPTKALAQDQARALAAFGLSKRVRPAIYDGDTPREARAQIRKQANVVLTNPDMLHVGILPNHAAWAELFANLAIVVVDEAHVYRGVFGSHVANVLRRLRRVAAAYGTEPRFLLTSATIANPLELAGRLTGLEDVRLIDEDGSPAPQRRIAVWNPPLTDEALGTRRSALGEAAELLARLVRDGARAICFMKSRKGVEVLSRLIKQELEAGDEPALAELVAPYRAGYTPQQRRELEGRLTRGELRAVITTDALELGIDIGELDAAVVVTFPGTVPSLRQMCGRAGRRGRGLAMYVAGEDALDQFFCRHPEDFLERPVEAAILDHESPLIFRQHLLCAAHEGPLWGGDGEFLGPRWEAHAEVLLSAGELRRRPAHAAGEEEDQLPESAGRGGLTSSTYVPRRPGSYPAAEVSLRSASPESFAIVDVSSGELLGATEATRAHSTVHEGAVYLHLGPSYEVRELDLDRT